VAAMGSTAIIVASWESSIVSKERKKHVVHHIINDDVNFSLPKALMSFFWRPHSKCLV